MTQERTEQFPLIGSTLEKLARAPVTESEIRTILPLMREEAEEVEINLNLSKKGMTSLGRRRFRNLERGRGPGMVEALKLERAKSLLAWCQANGERKIGKTEGTEGRGLQQAAADIIQILAIKSPTDEEIGVFLLKLNQRVKKGLGRKTKSFDSVPEMETKKWKELASVPPGTVAELWKWLTGSSGGTSDGPHGEE